jgi:hypothetical protein
MLSSYFYVLQDKRREYGAEDFRNKRGGEE